MFQPGDHIITGHDIYGGTYRLFDAVFTQLKLEFSFVVMATPTPSRKRSAPIPRRCGSKPPATPC
ncbi:MAG: PLP-dependent transferase [Planctomycetales bacterium]